MADNSSLSWSESASTLQHRRSHSGYSSSQYSTDSQSDKKSQRSSSSSTTPWVIDHLLDSSLPDELPLRVMFSFNSGQALPSVVQAHKYWHFEKEGRKIIQFLSSLEKITPSIADATDLDLQNPTEELTDFTDPHCPYDRFMDPGNEKLLKVKIDQSLARRASQGLPPEIVRKLLLSNMFRKDFQDVDWQQALTGLDYLRDLEETRRCSQREATSRLSITSENWRFVLCENPGAMAWVEKVLEEEPLVEGYYARISVNLRLWTMIDELRQSKFYKPNVLAMLNTLFPPSMGEPYRGYATPKALHRHRATFYHIMLAIESGNRKALTEFVEKLSIGTGYSWPEIRIQLETYLELAEAQIADARLVEEIDSAPPVPELSPERIPGTRSFPLAIVTTPPGSFEGQESMSDSPHLVNKSSFRKGHHRNTSKTILLCDIDLNEPKAIRSAPLADRTPIPCRPTSDSPGYRTTSASSSGTHSFSTKSGSPPKPIPLEGLGLGTFEAKTPEPTFLNSPEFAGVENFMAPKSPMIGTPANPLNDLYELRHRRTKSSGKGAQLPSDRPSMDRPMLRRDSSALRHVQSIEDVESIGRPYGANPLPGSNPPILNRKASFGEKLLRKVKSTTSLKKQPARDTAPVSRRGPPLTHMNSAEMKEAETVKGHSKFPSFSKKDSFGRKSLYSRRVSNKDGGNPLGISFGSSESIVQNGQGHISPRIFPTQEQQHSFTAFNNQSSPSLRRPSRPSSDFKSPQIQAASPQIFGSPIVSETPLPFMSYKLPVLGDNIDTFAAPALRQAVLREQRSTSFLSELRKSMIKTPKAESPRPEISEFATSPFIGLDAAVKSKLKKESSMPTLGFFSKKPKPETVLPETPKERAIMMQKQRSTQSFHSSVSPTKSTSPTRPFTPLLTTPAQRVRHKKSQTSLKGTNTTDGSTTPKSPQKSPSLTPARKLVRKFSREKVLTSADITEPFPEALRQSFSNQKKQSQDAKRSKEYDMPSAITSPDLYDLPPYAPGGTGNLTKNYIPPTNETLEEFHRKEYTRKWFLEESRARRYELGEPRERLQVEEMETMGLKRLRREEWPRVEGRNGKRKEGRKGWFQFGEWVGKRDNDR